MSAVTARTALQDDKQKLLHLWTRSKNCREEIRKLHKTASQLDTQPFAESDSRQKCIEHLQDVITAVSVAQNSATNCYEDLLEKIILMGRLSDLGPEDRFVRNRVIHEMEELLRMNDLTKITLARLNKQLQAKFTESVDTPINFDAELLSQPRGATPCNDKPVGMSLRLEEAMCTSTTRLCAQCGKLSAEGYLGTDEFAGQWFCGKCWQEFLQETDTCDEFSVCSEGDSLYSEVVNIPGHADLPGFVEVPHMSPLLCIGNQYSPASEEFDEVISACMPLDLDGCPAKHLCTKAIPFHDLEGLESKEASSVAAESIVAGARLVNDALEHGKRTLVHCEYGQNRSGAICCAYAVLFKHWTAKDAINYFRCCNLRDRHYLDQRPMNNEVFNSIIEQLEPKHD